MSGRYLSCAETAKLVRAALKEKFPAVKFSVTSKTYSGGASMRVCYTDGPATDDVKSITDSFEGASFDGMIDLKSYHSSVLNGEQVHFGADYIFVEHDYTPEVESAIQREMPIDGATQRPFDHWHPSFHYWFQQSAREYCRRQFPAS